MKVLIDAHMIGAHETGNETYIANLLQHLHALMGVDLAAAAAPAAVWPAFLKPTPVTRLPLVASSNWTRLAYDLPRLCRRWEADVLHATYVAPFFLTCPTVVTVHDVAFRRYPQFFSPRVRLIFGTLLPLSMRRAAAIITVSEHARREIEHFYPATRGKVHAIHSAHNSHLFRRLPPAAVQSIRQKYALDGAFILAVGAVQPRKNLVRVIKAFAAIRPDLPDLKLVIVGPGQWQAASVHKVVEAADLAAAVVFTGYVPNDDLAALYHAAELFVYPSLYEGFGLPILEAMACGTPVITANVASLPEVAGDAALLVNPTQVAEIAAAMRTILADDAVASRLRQQGLAHCQTFSWQRSARETHAVYQQVAHDSAGA